jgi:NAD(P)-dependent dehydrogenase (short-subunit alcohol dehydrogenase family)
MYSLQGKVAVVTGAGSGIGRALAQALAAKGCKLALADINEATLEETARGLPGPKPLLRRLDVSDRASVYAFAEAVKSRHDAVHVVINNAGVALSQRLVEVSYQDFEWLMGINFWGMVYGTKAFLPALLAQKEGTVVNVSSVFGLVAWPTQGVYNCSKFAIRGFTECLRIELAGTGVRALSVHPGGIRTNIARNQRFYQDFQGRTDAAAVQADFERLARTSPEQAAQAIIRAIEQGRERLLIGPDARIIDWIQRLMPVRYFRFIARVFRLGN